MQATDLRATDIPENGSKGFECNGEKYFAVKKDKAIYIYKNSCPHIGVALEWVEDQFLDSSHTMIQCANHGALFVIEATIVTTDESLLAKPPESFTVQVAVYVPAISAVKVGLRSLALDNTAALPAGLVRVQVGVKG